MLTDLFNKFCFPTVLISDRDTAFTSQEFVNFLRINDVKHHTVAVAAPWANGLVERVNRFLKSSLKKLIKEQDLWSIHVNKIQYVINNTIHSSIKATPSIILFGIEQRNNIDVKLTDFLSRLTEPFSDFEANRNDSRRLALLTTEKLKKYNKVYYDKRHVKPSVYKEGDLVLIRDSVKPSEDAKLKSNYKGPYRIEKVLNINRYVIKDIPGFNITSKSYNSVLSPDRIKPWVKPLPM